MRNEILIQKFGPVKDAKIDLNNHYQVLIGPQAAGKSTVCKIVYFCQKIRDYTLEFLMDEKQFHDHHPNEFFNQYLKHLTGKFMGCFGTTKHMEQFTIRYFFGDSVIKIFLNDDGFVRFVFSARLKEQICEAIKEAADMHINRLGSGELQSLMGSIEAIAVMRSHLKGMLNDLFHNDAEMIYIPAGRSLLATMADMLSDVPVQRMDLTMQEFIGLINETKRKFGDKMPEMVERYTKTVTGQINNMAVGQAYDLVHKILRADYISETDGEKIYFDEFHWVKLMYSSSGQQEALWILLLAFAIILEGRRAFVVMEEPEAHLFPEAQKDIVNLITLMVNASGSSVIVTTHSPYILAAMNIALYSEKVEGANGGGKAIVPKKMRIPYSTFNAFKLEPLHGGVTLESLMDDETHMIDISYIDGISTIANEELDALIELELGK